MAGIVHTAAKGRRHLESLFFEFLGLKQFALSLMLIVLLVMAAQPLAATYHVRIKDLGCQPSPPNPVMIAGLVKSASPLTISDGSGTLAVTGLVRLSAGDFVVVTGDYSGGSIAAAKATGYLGPARVEMIWVPAGSFLMGNTGMGDDVGPWPWPDELPQHLVSLSGYWIGKFEVTRGQYRKFMDSGGYSNPAYWSADGWQWRLDNWWDTQPVCWDAEAGFFVGHEFTQTEQHPVACVRWYEAEAFCSWAGMRLPTEAEWERAARWDGAHARIYPWGDTFDPEKCNWGEDHNPAGGGSAAAQTAPVGSYPGDISPVGCMDMGGNLLEFVSDLYAADYYSQTPVGGWVDPVGPSSGFERCTRGGSWDAPSIGQRNAERYHTFPWSHFFDDGVRAAR